MFLPTHVIRMVVSLSSMDVRIPLQVINRLPDTPRPFQRSSIKYDKYCDMFDIKMYITQYKYYTISYSCTPNKVFCLVRKYENIMFIDKFIGTESFISYDLSIYEEFIKEDDRLTINW